LPSSATPRASTRRRERAKSPSSPVSARRMRSLSSPRFISIRTRPAWRTRSRSSSSILRTRGIWVPRRRSTTSL
ncbi:hypothetical protein LTR40_013987, partial [Exophiala xenobiotica]